MQIIDDVEYLEVDEVAALLGVKKATIYAYVSRGVLDSFRQGVGRKRLYQRAAVEPGMGGQQAGFLRRPGGEQSVRQVGECRGAV